MPITGHSPPDFCLTRTPRGIRGVFCFLSSVLRGVQTVVSIDEKYMGRAVELAVQALGRTSPNPVVGAVVVLEGEVVGEGYHQLAGTPHAEIHALNQAGERARGATLYVTLEPCCHYGKTPPCVDAIIGSGIKRVVVAIQDPNPQVSGQGIARLKAAGIEVEVGVLEEEARRANEFFFKFITTGMPFVALKTAMTMDGKIATRTGDSRWVTGEKARRFVHELRNIYDAVLVGVGTVLKDNPMLNTRLDVAGKRDPMRVILDGRLEIPLDSQIVLTSNQQCTLVVTSRKADIGKIAVLEDAGVEVLQLGDKPDFIPLVPVLEELARLGVTSILVEGGGQVNASFLEAGLVDKVYWFIAPKICGGESAPTPVRGTGVEMMDQARKLRQFYLSRFDDDVLITGYF